MKIDEKLAIINELIENCRNNSYCQSCQFWDKEKGECYIQMHSNVGHTPDQW